MAFSITRLPANPALTGNQMLVELLCADADGMPFEWHGIRASLHGESSEPYFSTGDTITVSFREQAFGPLHTIVFTASATPSGVDQYSSIPTNFPNNLAYWTHIAAVIGAHPAITANLIVYANDTVDGYVLFVESPDLETDWQIQLATTSTTVTTNEYTSPTSTMPTRYRVFIEVWVAETDTSSKVKKALVECIPLRNSKIIVDISEIIHAAIEETLPDDLPAFDTQDPVVWDIVRNYYLRVYESAGAEEGYLTFEKTSDQVALCGGIPQSIYPNGNYIESLSASNSLLLWPPNKRIVGSAQPVFIPWYNYTDEAVVPALEVVFTYPDNTSATATFLTDHSVTVEPGRVAMLPIGFPSLASVERLTAVKYTARVIDAGDQSAYLSQPITCYVDYSFRENETYILYLNGFKCPEVIRVFGDTETELSVDREFALATLKPDYQVTDKMFMQFNQSWQNQYTYHTGFMHKWEAIRLQELLIYGLAWEYNADFIAPLIIQNKQFKVTGTRQTLHSYAIDVTRSMDDKWFAHHAATLSPSSTGNNILIDDNGDPLLDDEGNVLFG